MRKYLMIAILLIVSAVWFVGHATPTADEKYIEAFKEYYKPYAPLTVPTFDEYVRAETYDEVTEGLVEEYSAKIINAEVPCDSMAWETSYFTQSLNEMYRATGDRKYLEAGLTMARASLSNRDMDRNNPERCFKDSEGRIAPGWGTPMYAGHWFVFPVHSSHIGLGIVEFLLLAKKDPAFLVGLGEEHGKMITKMKKIIDWHDRQWIDGPGEKEGHYIYMDGEKAVEGQPLAFNRLSAMGRCHWALWKLTGATKYRDQALALGNYIKNRLPVYELDGQLVYLWKYNLPTTLVTEVKPWSERFELKGGEDISHAGLSMAFLADLSAAGEIFTAQDMEALGRACTNGFARLDNGILFGGIIGDPNRHSPKSIAVTGYWARLTPWVPEVYERISEYMMKYHRMPQRGVAGINDLAQLIRYRPAYEKAKK